MNASKIAINWYQRIRFSTILLTMIKITKSIVKESDMKNE